MSEYFDLATINTAIESTLATAVGIKRSQDLDELTENIPEMDLPLLQVVPNNWSGASRSSTHVNSFAGRGTPAVAIQEKTWVYDVYVFIAPVGQRFNESTVKLITIAAAITEVLDAQQEVPLFGEEAIRSFQYQAERGVIPFSNAEYRGIHITLTVELF